MNKKDLYDALSGIDEKYLSDSENFSEISSDFRRAKMKKISTVSALCSCLLILPAVFLSSDVMKNNFNNVPETAENSGAVQTDISDNNSSNDISSDIIMTTENKTEVHNITETTENNSVITSGTPAPAENLYIPAVSDNTENLITEPVPAETVITETSEIFTTDTAVTPDGITDSYNKTDFSGISVDEWLENPEVIWDGTDTKSYLNSEYISSGNTRISEKLSDLMYNNPDSAVYAVMVDFSSCINESELLDWEYNGCTVSDLKIQISETAEYSENSYTYTDSGGTEHTEYFLTPESEEKISEMEIKISEIKSAYRDMKIQEFRYSFNNNGLEIYTDRLNGIQEENFCFYTFATKKHLEEFKCKNNEAFIFYPANYFK